MLGQSLGILFYQKKRANYENGNMPVYLRITVNGNRAELGTKQSCDPEHWNSQAQRAKVQMKQAVPLIAFWTH